jgi:hypothetical protein
VAWQRRGLRPAGGARRAPRRGRRRLPRRHEPGLAGTLRPGRPDRRQNRPPDLYIACGISGAIQHIVGCKGAKKILAINKDPHAPMLARSDYAVVGDLHEVVAAVIEELRRT